MRGRPRRRESRSQPQRMPRPYLPGRPKMPAHFFCSCATRSVKASCEPSMRCCRAHRSCPAPSRRRRQPRWRRSGARPPRAACRPARRCRTANRLPRPDPALPWRWECRQVGQAARRSDRVGADLAGLDIARRGDGRDGGHVGVAAHHGRQRLGAALVGHVQHLHAGGLLQYLQHLVVVGALARRRERDLVGLRGRRLDQVGQRLVGLSALTASTVGVLASMAI